MLGKVLKFGVIVTLLLLVIVIQLFIFVGGRIYDNKGSLLTFRNNSGALVDSVTITVASEACEARKLAANGEITCQLTNLSDGGYNVEVGLIDGRVVSNESMGYVTGGMNFRAVITLDEQGELHLEQSMPDT